MGFLAPKLIVFCQLTTKVQFSILITVENNRHTLSIRKKRNLSNKPKRRTTQENNDSLEGFQTKIISFGNAVYILFLNFSIRKAVFA